MAYRVGGVAAMAYGAARVDGVWGALAETSDPPEAMWWRSSPDLAMPNSARHRRDTRLIKKSLEERLAKGRNAGAKKRTGHRQTDRYNFDHD
jgi:hypothetical protein